LRRRQQGEQLVALRRGRRAFAKAVLIDSASVGRQRTHLPLRG
jgi:hypothetical protein